MMLTQLEINLQNAVNQKNTYLTPGNIRNGVTALGVTGTLPDDLIHDTSVQNLPITGDRVGVRCVVTNNSWTEFDGIYLSSRMDNFSVTNKYFESYNTISNPNIIIPDVFILYRDDNYAFHVKNISPYTVTIVSFSTNFYYGFDTSVIPLTLKPNETYDAERNTGAYNTRTVSITATNDDGIKWTKIAFTNDVSGDEYSSNITKTNQILGI